MSGARNTIALLGLRCSGKSTVGRLLAHELGRSFVDLDDEVVRLGRYAGLRAASAGELLRAAGLARFRELEAWALRRALEPSPTSVLATGGGVVERSDCRSWLARAAVCVWLDVPDAVLVRRQAADPAPRPALTGLDPVAEVALLRARRAPHYRALAELVLECDDAPAQELVRRIVDRLPAA